MNTKIIDLEAVFISSRAVEKWKRLCKEQVRTLVREEVIEDPLEVPIEMGRVSPDGTLTIFVHIPGHRIEMVVPEGEWQYNN